MGRQTYLIALGGNVYGPWGRPRALLAMLLGRSDYPRHAELVSASTAARERRPPVDAWTLKRVQGDGALIDASHIVETAPLGPSLRRYANALALIETDLSPPDLLAHLKTVERAHGRRPGRRWGARSLDLDIVGWSGGVWISRILTVPHPASRQRRFVLGPLVEIAPDWRDPVTRLTARQLLARLDRRRPRP